MPLISLCERNILRSSILDIARRLLLDSAQDEPGAARHHLQDEPARQLLRQCRDGKRLLDGEERAGIPRPGTL